jgi:acyl carrier protein
MTVDELLQPILNTKRPLLLTDSKATVPAWDSLAQMTIVAAVEELVNAELSTAEVLSLKSVTKVVEVCRAHGVELTVAPN